MARESDAFPEADRTDGSPHPREVYELLGHEKAEQRYIQAKQSGRMHHAWLITGPPGIGKATLAYRIARDRLGGQTLLDQSLDVPASDPVSQRIESQGHGNLRILRRPWDQKTKKFRKDIPVGSVRELATFFQSTASETDGWRVCIVDTADDLNRNSENGILKLLEEPPVRTLFILLSSEPGRLLPTIRSRCMALPLHAVPKDDLARWLTARTDVRPEFREAAIALSRGAPGKALALTGHVESVLMPLKRFMLSLSGSGDDMALAKSLAPIKEETARSLFWYALIDTLHAQSVYAASGLWSGPFDPIQTLKSPAKWVELTASAQATRRAEAAINLDKTASLFNLLSQVRAA